MGPLLDLLGGLLGRKARNVGSRCSSEANVWEFESPFWAVLGTSWAVLGPSWAVLGFSWAILGRSWGPLGPSWSVGCPKILINNLVKICDLGLLGSSGSPLGASWWPWAVLRPSWALWSYLWATRGPLGAYWVPVRTLLARFGALLAPEKSRGDTRGHAGNRRRHADPVVGVGVGSLVTQRFFAREIRRAAGPEAVL